VASPDSHHANRVVRIGVVREISEAFLWNIGKFAARYGITPKFVEAGAYPQQVQALEKGNTDFGIIGVPQIATLAASGPKNIKVIAGYSLGGQEMVLRNEVKARKWAGLEGKTIGAPLFTAAGIMLQIAMDIGHANKAKIKVANSGFTGTAELQALQANQWQALVFWPPTDAEAVAAGYAHWAPSNSQLDIDATPAGPANGLMAAGPTALKDPSLVADFMKAYVASLVWTRSHPSQWISLASQLTSVKPSAVKESLTHLKLNYGIDKHAVLVVGKYGPRFGFTKKVPTMAQINKVIDPSFLAQATGKSVAALTKPLRLR
jgi:ABC-type nitrate/sulfonate/bicarbonate transport system substrate-binding protein